MCRRRLDFRAMQGYVWKRIFGSVSLILLVRWDDGDLSTLIPVVYRPETLLTIAAERCLMQGRQRVFDHFQFFLGGYGVTHLETVGSGVIGMFKTVPGVQT
jgi:hypothetical protein